MTVLNGWTVLVIPAIAPEDKIYQVGPGTQDVYRRREGEVLLPEREPQAVLDDMRTAIGVMNFAAQYQQTPVPPGGNVIKGEWIRYYDREPEDFELLIASWDTASTIGERSDYSVGQLWGVIGADFYLLENVRGRYEAPLLQSAIVEAMERWRPTATIIETTELGRALTQSIRRTTEHRPQLHKPRFDKEARLLAASVRFQTGQVHLPRSAVWLDVYLTELLSFPFETHDDQVDATSLAINYITGLTARRRPMQRRNLVRRSINRAYY